MSASSNDPAVLCECRFQPSNGKKHHDSCPAAFENAPSQSRAPKIPEFWEIERKRKNGEPLNALELFVYCNEPAGREAEQEFKEQLEAALQYACQQDTKEKA